MHKACKSRLLLLPSPFKIPSSFLGKKVTWIFCFLKLICSLVLFQEKQQQRSNAGVTLSFLPERFAFRKLAARRDGEAQKGAIACLALCRTLVTARCCSGPRRPIPSPESREGVIYLDRIRHP